MINKKADLRFSTIVAGIIAIIIIVMIVTNPYILDVILKKFPRIIPNYENETIPTTGPELIRYNIGQDIVEYSDDSIYWYAFPEDWNKAISIRTKNLTHGQARYYFSDNYYFDQNARKDLKREIELPSSQFIASITDFIQEISDDSERGTVQIVLNLTEEAREYYGKMYRIGKLIEEPGIFTGGYTNTEAYFRYFEDQWEWKDSIHDWEVTQPNPGGDSDATFKEIAKQLYEKNYGEGVQIILREMQYGSETLFKVNLERSGTLGAVEFYYRYRDGWEFSYEPSGQWVKVEDRRNGVYSPSNEQFELMQNLVGKNLEEGKIQIIKSKTHEDSQSSLSNEGIKSRYTLKLNDLLVLVNSPETSIYEKRNADKFRQTIRDNAIAWRDYPLNNPMIIKVNNEKLCLFVDVERVINAEEAYLVADIGNPVSRC